MLLIGLLSVVDSDRWKTKDRPLPCLVLSEGGTARREDLSAIIEYAYISLQLSSCLFS